MSKPKQIEMMIWKIGRTALLASVLLLLWACGITQESKDGMIAESSPVQNEPDADAIRVEVLIESDSDSAVNLEVDIDARKHPESVYLDTIEVPYREEFTIPKDTFIPLTSTKVQADKDEAASWISCTILYDGEVVATHKSRGDQAKAVCEKKFRLGPG
ncbi:MULTISPECIES: hypothetical protein [unclassified Paenibacillus]|uniref:hypothetical protein n=1 Tax=unclassified Paenibacillus TaxID=185978 RepID=UPI0003E219C2|nr:MULTISPECIES: hypothetical protein [unclassified Paenibacillus]ETT42406.1 hypothetical protein C162_25430 [Paenibacillus sp. FSL R7-269]OMF93064.1 hypothetical protein BK147_19145 [Paenibacillus sp. FSL R7-0337]